MVPKRVSRAEILLSLRWPQFFDAIQHQLLRCRSCLIHLLSTVNMVTKAVYEGTCVYFWFLDFIKSFNAVNQQINCAKLTVLGFSDHLVIWIIIFLTARVYRCALTMLYITKLRLPMVSGKCRSLANSYWVSWYMICSVNKSFTAAFSPMTSTWEAKLLTLRSCMPSYWRRQNRQLETVRS